MLSQLQKFNVLYVGKQKMGVSYGSTAKELNEWLESGDFPGERAKLVSAAVSMLGEHAQLKADADQSKADASMLKANQDQLEADFSAIECFSKQLIEINAEMSRAFEKLLKDKDFKASLIADLLEKKEVTALLYSFEFEIKGRRFKKVGISTVWGDRKRQYKKLNIFNIKVKALSLYKAFQLEQRYLRKYGHLTGHCPIKFGGHTEVILLT